MKRYTKADYEQAANGLAFSMAIQLGTARAVEGWLAFMDQWTRNDAERLERKLLADAWARLQKQRAESGECTECGEKQGHRELCSQYVRPRS